MLLLLLQAVAGPVATPPASATPAGQAIALYAVEHRLRPTPRPCRREHDGEITVCGTPDGRAADRLPLPDARGVREGPRAATGEMPGTSGGVGGSPALQGKGAGLTLTVPLGKRPQGGAAISGNGG